MEFRGPHLRYVDGLRAIAVLAVIFYHGMCEAAWAVPLVNAPMQMNLAWWFARLASKGAHGVDLFFVISGFCLSYPALARIRGGRASRIDCGSFLAKRIVRIIPPYYIAIGVLISIVLVAAHFGLRLPGALGKGLSPISVFKQAFFLDRGADLVNDSFWTLAVEFRWYLAFPFVLLLYVRSPRAFFALLVACVVAYNFTSLRAIDIGTLPGFMLGIVAADWRAVTHRLTRFALPAVFVAFCFALLLEPFSSVPSRFGLADLAGYWAQTNIGWQLAAFAFVVAAGHVAWLRKLLELPILCGIGAAAYGIYLVHQPIVSAWGESAGKHLDPLSNIAGSVFLALAGGLLFSYIAERPFLAERTRNRLLLGLKKPIGRGFALAGIPAGIELASGLGLTSRPLSPSVDVLQKPFEMEVHGPLA